MADKTARFKFTRLTQALDKLSLDNWKFGVADRDAIDRILHLALEGHHHSGVPSPDVLVSGSPLVSVGPTGGIMPAGASFYYQYTLIDIYGHESVGSRVATAITPPQVTPPGPPTVVGGVVGGGLAGGRYSYVVSATTGGAGSTDETTLSPSVEISLIPTQTATLTLPALPSGATGFNVYRRGPQNTDYGYVGSTSSSTFTDSLSTPSSRTAPKVNMTNRSGSVTLTLPITPPTHYGWRIYRTLNSADWSASLVATIPSASVTAFVDTGHGAGVGSPGSTGAAVGSPTKIDLVTEVTGILPPGLVATSEEMNFGFDGVLFAATGSWYWLNEWEHCMVVGLEAHLGRGSSPSALAVLMHLESFSPGGSGWTSILALEINPGLNGVSGGNPQLLIRQGEFVRLVVDQAGGGATPTDRDLTVTLKLLVRHGSALDSGMWI